MKENDSNKPKNKFSLPKIELPNIELPNIDIMKTVDQIVDGVGKGGAAVIDSSKKVVEDTQKAIVNVIDQNGDGEINFKDVAVVVDNIDKAVGNVAKDFENKKLEKERRELQPIFVEDLDRTNFHMSKLVRIVDYDKRRAESPVCKGSIGYKTKEGELTIINLYRRKLKHYGLDFFPSNEGDFYYVDPSDHEKYIELDKYFDYLKVCRINELQRIAQDLGAKHFKITYKEEVSFSKKDSVKAKGKAEMGVKGLKKGGSVDAQHERGEKEFTSVHIAAEMDCVGHSPQNPKLHYLKNDPSINNLIYLRMNTESSLLHHKYTIQFSNSSGIREKDAVAIDAAIASMSAKGNANISVAIEANKENRKIIEYEIDFE